MTWQQYQSQTNKPKAGATGNKSVSKAVPIAGRTGSPTPKYVAPAPVRQPDVTPVNTSGGQAVVISPIQESSVGGGFGGVESSGGGDGAGGGVSAFDWRSMMPSIPQEPVLTPEKIQEFLQRARGEGSLIYDPQKRAVTDNLQKMLLSLGQGKGDIEQQYQEILDYVDEWKKTETEKQGRVATERGFGKSGSRMVEELGISEKGMKQGAGALTEKARKMGDVTEQENLVQEQANAQVQGLTADESNYVNSRSAELQDAYKTNKQALDQQGFSNQLNIATFGMNAENMNTQNFLAQQALELDTWYKQAQIGLQEESLAMEAAAQSVAEGSVTGGSTGGGTAKTVSGGTPVTSNANAGLVGTNNVAFHGGGYDSKTLTGSTWDELINKINKAKITPANTTTQTTGVTAEDLWKQP